MTPFLSKDDCSSVLQITSSYHVTGYLHACLCVFVRVCPYMDALSNSGFADCFY